MNTPINEAVELAPCPFCGEAPILHHIEPHTHGLVFAGTPIMPDHPGSWTIECCDVGMIKESRAEVLAAWNRRAALPPPIVEPVKMTQELYNLLFSWATYNIKRGYSDEAKTRGESEFLAHIGTLTTPASAPSDGAADARDAWISVDERLPEVGILVLVYSPNGPYNYPDDIRIDFDCIDPNDDDHASWLNHNEHYEHFCCVAKPEGSIGPSEKAPYTHWQPIPVPPIASTHTTTGGENV